MRAVCPDPTTTLALSVASTAGAPNTEKAPSVDTGTLLIEKPGVGPRNSATVPPDTGVPVWRRTVPCTIAVLLKTTFTPAVVSPSANSATTGGETVADQGCVPSSVNGASGTARVVAVSLSALAKV